MLYFKDRYNLINTTNLAFSTIEFLLIYRLILF